MQVRQVGYDKEIELDPFEIEIMYLEEGVSPEESNKRAKSLYREIHNMISNEKYSWRKARKHEARGINMDAITRDED